MKFTWEKGPDDWDARVQSIKSVVGCANVVREYRGRLEFEPEICAGLIDYERLAAGYEMMRFSFRKSAERRCKAALKRLSEALVWNISDIEPTHKLVTGAQVAVPDAPTVWPDLVRPQFWPGYTLWIWRRPPLMFVAAGVGSAGQLVSVAGPIPIVRGYSELRGALLAAERRAKRAMAMPIAKTKEAEPGALLVAAKITSRMFRRDTAFRDPAYFEARRRFNKGTVSCIVYRGPDENGRPTCQITTYLPIRGSAQVDLKSRRRVTAATMTGDLVPILRGIFEKAGAR